MHLRRRTSTREHLVWDALVFVSVLGLWRSKVFTWWQSEDPIINRHDSLDPTKWINKVVCKPVDRASPNESSPPNHGSSEHSLNNWRCARFPAHGVGHARRLASHHLRVRCEKIPDWIEFRLYVTKTTFNGQGSQGTKPRDYRLNARFNAAMGPRSALPASDSVPQRSLPSMVFVNRRGSCKSSGF